MQDFEDVSDHEFVEALAEELNAIPKRDLHGERKVWIWHAFERMHDRYPDMTIGDFKQRLRELRPTGKVQLARADMVAAFPAKLVALSETKDGPAVHHFIERQPRDLVSNPAWVTTALADVFEDLETKVPPEWLPKLSSTKPAGKNAMRAQMKEYGCGVHGCVLPTLSPDVVLKVTDDASEAQFAADIEPTLVAEVTTRYLQVAALSAKRKGIPLFLLWREAAHDVGEVDTILGEHAEHAINRQHAAAQQVYVAFHEGRLDAVIELVEEWRGYAAEMADIPELRDLARGMIKIWDEQQIFFGDIHGGNIGRVDRDGKKLWLITDPGHLVVVDPEQAKKQAADVTQREALAYATTMPMASPERKRTATTKKQTQRGF